MDIEYIIVDGLSNDKTVDIIKEYEPLFQGRLKWISETDNGLYDAMNKGIRMATGDIVGIINSDDFYHREDIIEKVVEVFKTSTVQAVYGDVRFVRSNNLDKTVRYYSSKYFFLAYFDMDLCQHIRLFLLIDIILKNLVFIRQIIKLQQIMNY